MRKLSLLAAAALALAACTGEPRDGAAAGEHGGTVIIATAGDASALIPVYNDRASDAQISGLVFERLAEIDNNLNVVGDKGWTPRLAESWEWAPDSLSIAFELDPDARWHDGRPVRASDVRFSYELYVDPKVGSPVQPLLSNVDSVTVRDSLTAVVWYERRKPDQFFEFAYQVYIMPEHLLRDAKRDELRASPFAKQPVGSGRFRFARWVPGQSIEIVADTTHYRTRPKLDRVIWSVVPDPAAATAKLFAGQADFFEILSPDQIKELQTKPDLKAVQYPSLDYGFLIFNLRDRKTSPRPHPILGDRELRRALAMALDREAMVKNVFDTLGAVPVGPVPRGLNPDPNIRQLPYDVARANAVLDSLGWRDGNGDGVRERNGRPLQFSLVVPTSSAIRRKYGVLVQDQLKKVGARVNLEELEFTAYLDRLLVRDFDASLNAFHHDPGPGTIRQLWSTEAARARQGTNQGYYANPAFDAAVDSALASGDPAQSSAQLRRAIQLIVDDVPAVFLYEPRMTAGMHKRIQPAGMRPDAWWANLAEWSIPADQRIVRDRPPAARTASR